MEKFKKFIMKISPLIVVILVVVGLIVIFKLVSFIRDPFKEIREQKVDVVEIFENEIGS